MSSAKVSDRYLAKSNRLVLSSDEFFEAAGRWTGGERLTGMALQVQKKRSRRLQALLILGVFLLVTSVLGISAYVGWALTHPARKAIHASPSALGLAYESVHFQSRQDHLDLAGWLIQAPQNRQTIIFAHGYRQNRSQDDVPGLELAQALVQKGFNVLLFDFRNSGESAGSVTSVGEYEVYDLLGAVDFIRSRAALNQTITLFGFSMGAATAILAGAQEPSVAGVIADSSFADLREYLEANLSTWSKLPAMPFNETVIDIIPFITKLDADAVSPVNSVKNFNGRPLLLIHGEADRIILIHNSELLQQAYPQAELLRIPGAKHVQSFKVSKEQYLNKVSSFLDSI